MNILENKILSLLTPLSHEMLLNIVLVKQYSSNKNIILSIMLEKTDGSNVTISNCADFSRNASVILDVEESLINKRYNLEVGSAGIDRPLVKKEDFERFKNNNVIIKTSLLIDGRKNFQGLLLGLEKDNVKLQIKKLNIVTIPLSNIDTAHLDILKDLDINQEREHDNQ